MNYFENCKYAERLFFAEMEKIYKASPKIFYSAPISEQFKVLLRLFGQPVEVPVQVNTDRKLQEKYFMDIRDVIYRFEATFYHGRRNVLEDPIMNIQKMFIDEVMEHYSQLFERVEVLPTLMNAWVPLVPENNATIDKNTIDENRKAEKSEETLKINNDEVPF